MKTKIFFTAILLIAFIFSSSAQVLRQMTVEPVERDGREVMLCGSPGDGVLVFITGIQGLDFQLNLPDRLINQRYESLNNRYVLCVQPTERLYWITIRGEGFEPINLEVWSILPNTPQYFRITEIVRGEGSIPARDANSLGVLRMSENEYAEAERHFSNAVEQEPDNGQFHVNLGNARMRQEKFTEAIAAFRNASRLNPMNAEMHHLLGNAYFANANYEAAANSFRIASELAPSNTQYLADLHRALRSVDNPPEALFNMGRHHLERFNYSEALRYFREAADLSPNNDVFRRYVTTTDILHRQEQYMSLADEAFRRARNAVRPVVRTSANVTPEQRRHIDLFRVPLNYVSRARSLGSLSREMQEAATFYEFQLQYEEYRADLLSRRELREFWSRHPHIERPSRRVLYPSVGVGVGVGDIFAFSFSGGVRVFDIEQLVNIHVGIQYTGYYATFYQTPEGGTRPEGDALHPWQIGAHQISFPATLQLNVFRSRQGTPWAVFAAATVQYNYNINGRVRFISDTGNSEFVNRTGISTIFSLGYTTNRWSASLYFRLNDDYLFNREEIMRYSTPLPPNSDENRFNRIIDHRFMIGGQLSFFF